MARIWQAGARRASQQSRPPHSVDDNTEPVRSSDRPMDLTQQVFSSPSLSPTPDASDKYASNSEPNHQDPATPLPTNKDIMPPPHLLISIDQLQRVWGHVRKPTDLVNQHEWSRPLHWKEKMAYMFWKFASQESINEILACYAKENLTRPRREVKMVMGRLLAYDCVYDSGEESGDDEEEEVVVDGELWDEVSLEEIDDEEMDVGGPEGIQDDGHSEPSSLLAEALEAMQEMVNEDQEMEDSDTEKSSTSTPTSRHPEPLVSSEGEDTSKIPLTVAKPQPEGRTKQPKRTLQDQVPQSSKPAKRARPSLDPARLAKELRETWRADQAPVAPEVKETRIAIRIVGQRGSKSIKYKIQWAEAGDFSFPDSWVDRGDGAITAAMVREWEAPRKGRGRRK